MTDHAEAIALELCSVSERNLKGLRPVTMKPIHRLMARLVAFGVSRTELAEDTAYPFDEIRKVTDSEWFQEEVTRHINELGEDQVQKRLEGAVLDSVTRLISLRDNPGTKDAVALQACNSIINRVLGTPTQHIITEKKSKKDPLSEMEELDQKLLQLKTEQVKHTQIQIVPVKGTVDTPYKI